MGYLKIVRGGVKESKYLTGHPTVDEIHIMGSDKTFDAIVYGTGDMAHRNTLTDTPITDKTVIGELGNVSPLIVVPGDWKESKFDNQADNVVSTLGLLNGAVMRGPPTQIFNQAMDLSEMLSYSIKLKSQLFMPIPLGIATRMVHHRKTKPESPSSDC